MQYTDKKAVQEVIETIKKDHPYRDCNQCRYIYKECTGYNDFAMECNEKYQEAVRLWEARLRKWEGRL